MEYQSVVSRGSKKDIYLQSMHPIDNIARGSHCCAGIIIILAVLPAFSTVFVVYLYVPFIGSFMRFSSCSSCLSGLPGSDHCRDRHSVSVGMTLRY